MHEWAAISHWSRPSTKMSIGHLDSHLSTSSGKMILNVASVASTSPRSPRFDLRRCQTTLEHDQKQVYHPRRRYCESCTVDYIRHLEARNKETEAKLKNTMHVLNMQRSKSDLDTRNNTPSNIGSGLMMGHGLLRERSQIYVTNVPDQMKRESTQGGTKQEMKVGVAIVPRKGLISLSTADQSDIVTGVPDERKWTPLMMHDTHSAGSGSGKKSLIKNKAILEQIRLGNKLLEDAEEERRQKEEISQSLGDYTIQDLQSKLLEMTDNKVLGRSRILLADPGSTENSRKGVASKTEKSITLPAIKNLNPFIMKS